MGANHSHVADSNLGRRGGPTKTGSPSDYIFSASKKAASPKGKPSPPSQPKATEVTHNSLTVTWLTPRHNSGNTVFAYTVELTTPAQPKAWTTITKCCQGNSYQVKNLKPDTEYLVRVRAENIHGVSKASRPSDVVQTKLYETVEDVYSPSQASPEESGSRGGNPLRRRHSINLHLEGGVTSILNHTDIQVKATESKVSTTAGSSSNQELDNVDGKAEGEGGDATTTTTPPLKRSTLVRDGSTRGSLQSRKRSLPILLPGTRTNSLSKLRDSQTFPNIKSKAGNSNPESVTDSLKRRGESSLRNRSASDANSSFSGSREDVMDGKAGRNSPSSSKDLMSSTEEDLKKDCSSSSKRDSKRDSKSSSERDSKIEEEIQEVDEEEEEDEEDSDNPWERGDSMNEVSDRIMSAPLCDDLKIALYARSVPENPSETDHKGRSLHPAVEGGGGEADFRTLQRLLHSDDIIVKPSRSLPDVAGTGSAGGKASGLHRNVINNNSNNNNKLTTILDLEEDEESVRVTTL